MLNRLFKSSPLKRPTQKSYAAIVAAARRPGFYAEWGVADTVEGRFDMLALHAFLAIDRLTGQGPEARDAGQALADALFADMDRSLREMGAGDVSVPKKVRRMAEVFYGRVGAYTAALAQADAAALEQAVTRNVFGGGEASGAAPLARYMRDAKAALAAQPLARQIAGEWRFPEIAA